MATEKREIPLHRAGLEPPRLAKLPEHVALVMDGNGRWANARGLKRTAGHAAGADALLDVVAGAVELGLREVSAFGFSTENWRRSPEEVHFLMGYSRRILHDYRDTLNAWNVRVRWAGRKPRLWKSVLKELHLAEEMTRENTGTILNMCINYGGRAEIADAAAAIARDAAAGILDPRKVDESVVARYLYVPDMRDVDLFIRTSGEQRTSNFLMWQSAYAELYFTDTAWPDFDRRQLWAACESFVGRERRFGTAVDKVAALAQPGESAAPTAPGEFPAPAAPDTPTAPPAPAH